MTTLEDVYETLVAEKGDNKEVSYMFLVDDVEKNYGVISASDTGLINMFENLRRQRPSYFLKIQSIILLMTLMENKESIDGEMGKIKVGLN